MSEITLVKGQSRTHDAKDIRAYLHDGDAKKCIRLEASFSVMTRSELDEYFEELREESDDALAIDFLDRVVESLDAPSVKATDEDGKALSGEERRTVLLDQPEIRQALMDYYQRHVTGSGGARKNSKKSRGR